MTLATPAGGAAGGSVQAELVAFGVGHHDEVAVRAVLADDGRSQSGEAVALGLGKGRALVGQRIGEQCARGGVESGGNAGYPSYQKRRLTQPARKSELL